MASFDSQLLIPVTSPPFMWDGLLDQRMMAGYNQMLQSTTDFHSRMDSPSVHSHSSDGSLSPVAGGRTSKATTEMGNAVPNKVERRREQNRQSQRAYRDRKEKHQRDLEGQIAVWKQKHEKLVKSYTSQTKEVSQLKAQVENLNARISSLQSDLPEMWGEIDQSHQDFDLVPFYDKKSGVWSRDAFDS